MYNQIESNKRKTWILVILFSLFIMGLFTSIGAASDMDPLASLLFGFIFSVGYCLVSFLVSERVVLMTHGGQQITKETGRELYNLVENLAITAGIPMPKVYVIDDPAPNAFAMGRDPKHASVTFTTGLLKIMDKTELEAIAAHELSHIKNYDIRLMTVVVVLLGMTVLLADVLLRVLLHQGRGNSRNFPWPLLILIPIAGLVSPLVANLVKLAISRTREYLADASAALLTRHPDALASALEKLKTQGKKLQSANHATAHLFISNPFGRQRAGRANFQNRLFSTHPPIDDRIAKLRGMTR